MTLDSQKSACKHGLDHVKAWEVEGGHSEGICQGASMEGKCERHKTQRSGGHEKTKSQETKKNKKRSAAPIYFFFWSKAWTLTRTSDPSQKAPSLDLWTADRARFAIEYLYGVYYVYFNPSKTFSLLAKTTFLGYYNGYYGITGVIPCLGEQPTGELRHRGFKYPNEYLPMEIQEQKRKSQSH